MTSWQQRRLLAVRGRLLDLLSLVADQGLTTTEAAARLNVARFTVTKTVGDLLTDGLIEELPRAHRSVPTRFRLKP